ncbi:MAG TPA: tRNA pseudouridine(55) synthase TruB [Cryptosporangiaceae bacterium]|nr:tRNA pseudouridine(55) synthase TruB [Cryptosporangiaceae bacterium]
MNAATKAPGRRADRPPATSGLVVVDKPAGMTSHDVVARVRRIAGTRKVGHAGTLDPMATGVLVVGVERATKLLGHLTLTAKAYTATIRLGLTTVTDDAEGEPTGGSSAAGVTEVAVVAGMAALTGQIAQVPSAVSAVKVAGRRSYDRVRAGETVELAARDVTVARFALLGARRPTPELLDLDVEVECTAGTYVRALARDLGTALGVGGHLTALRRTRVGTFGLAQARTLDELAGLDDPVAVPLDAAVATAFPRRDVDAADARVLAHGGRLPAVGTAGVYGVFGPDGRVIALVVEADGVARPEVVLRPAP